MAKPPEPKIKPFASDLRECLEECAAAGDQAARELLLDYHKHRSLYMAARRGSPKIKSSRVGTGDEAFQPVSKGKK